MSDTGKREHTWDPEAAFLAEYDFLLKYAYYISKDHHLCHDIVQGAYEKVLKLHVDLQNIEYRQAYLKTCVRNVANDMLKKQRSMVMVDPARIAQALAGMKGKLDARRVELLIWLNQYIGSYPPEMQEAYILHYLEGYPVKELAVELGKTPNTLSQQFRRMRKKIPPDEFMNFVLLIFLMRGPW